MKLIRLIAKNMKQLIWFIGTLIIQVNLSSAFAGAGRRSFL
jgi:hypothetical protein